MACCLACSLLRLCFVLCHRLQTQTQTSKPSINRVVISLFDPCKSTICVRRYIVRHLPSALRRWRLRLLVAATQTNLASRPRLTHRVPTLASRWLPILLDKAVLPAVWLRAAMAAMLLWSSLPWRSWWRSRYSWP